MDSNDVRNLVLAKMELFNALLSEDLHGASLLVFANKSDIQGAKTAEEICSVFTGIGLTRNLQKPIQK